MGVILTRTKIGALVYRRPKEEMGKSICFETNTGRGGVGDS